MFSLKCYGIIAIATNLTFPFVMFILCHTTTLLAVTWAATSLLYHFITENVDPTEKSNKNSCILCNSKLSDQIIPSSFSSVEKLKIWYIQSNHNKDKDAIEMEPKLLKKIQKHEPII